MHLGLHPRVDRVLMAVYRHLANQRLEPRVAEVIRREAQLEDVGEVARRPRREHHVGL